MPVVNKIKCPKCGIDMNHHADKIDYSTAGTEDNDPGIGGAVQEVHTCPGCGKTVLRREG